MQSSLLQEELGIHALNLFEVRNVVDELKWLINAAFSSDLGRGISARAKLILNEFDHCLQCHTQTLLQLLKSFYGAFQEASGDSCFNCE